MSKPSQLQSVRNILLCVLVFFAGTLFLNLFSGVIIVVLLYLLLRYRNRIKELERGVPGTGAAGSGEIPSSSEP